MERFKAYLLAVRPRFFTAVIVPTLLGASGARYDGYEVDGPSLLLTLIGIIFIHGGINVANDYYDHVNGTDENNTERLTPFTGGSRTIQDGIITPGGMLTYSLLLLTAGVAIGLYLAVIDMGVAGGGGETLLLIGALGIFTGYSYSAPPLFLAGRGLGEAVVGLNFGVLVTLGSYCVQTGTVSLLALILSLPVALLITALVYINEFPDYRSDREAGKRNLVVRLGKERARYGLFILAILALLTIAGGVASKVLPPIAILAALGVLPALGAGAGLIKDFESGAGLIPHIKKVILSHLLTGLILTLALLY